MRRIISAHEELTGVKAEVPSGGQSSLPLSIKQDRGNV